MMRGARRSQRLPAAVLAADTAHLRNVAFHGRDLLAVEPVALDKGPSAETATPRVRDASERPKTIAILGDSISHGVRSAGCAHTEHAWPNLLAQTLGMAIAAPQMIHAPFNADVVAARLAPGVPYDRVRISRMRLIATAYRTARDAARQNQAATPEQAANPNLAVSGYNPVDLVNGRVDAGSRFALMASTVVGLRGLTANGKALEGSVLGPHKSAVAALESRVRENGPVDFLILAIGANCALQAFITCQPRWSGEPPGDGTPPVWDPHEKVRVWRPRLFAAALYALLDRIDDAERPLAKRVLVVTVPHVTVAPIVAGEGSRLKEAPDYFERYVPRWEEEDRIRGRRRMYGAEVRRIDQTIDVYNRLLADAVQQRNDRDWSLFDLCALLDHYALLRNNRNQAPRARPFPPTPAALERLDASVLKDDDDSADPALLYLDTRYPRVEVKHGRRQLIAGGLVSLDGAHPTGAAQGLVAHHAIDALARAGVPWAGCQLQEAIPWADLHDSLTAAAVGPSDLVPPPIDGAWAQVGAFADFFDVLAAAIAKSPLGWARYVKRAVEWPFSRGPGRPRR